MCSAAILSIAALSAAPALAQKKTAKTCQEEWRANKAANEAAKITEKDYVAKCRAESTTAKPAVAPPAAAPATTAAKPVTGKPKDARQAEYARERACVRIGKLTRPPITTTRSVRFGSRTCSIAIAVSALPPKADIRQRGLRFGARTRHQT